MTFSPSVFAIMSKPDDCCQTAPTSVFIRWMAIKRQFSRLVAHPMEVRVEKRYRLRSFTCSLD